MELLEYLYIIRKRIWIIVAITVVATLVSSIVSIFVMKPVYEAKVTIIIGRAPNNNADKVQYNDLLMYQKLVKTYAELAKSKLVAEETISQLEYDDIKPAAIQSALVVTPKGDTQILEVTMQNKSPQRAMMLTNTLSKVFIQKVKELMHSEDISIMEKADLPTIPVKPNVRLNIIIAAFLGLMSSLGLVFLMEYLDSTIKTERDIEKYIAITVLASIPYISDKEK